MKEHFQKLSTLSTLFLEARMPEMAGPETPQEAERPRKMPPDVSLGKKREDLTQKSLDDFVQMGRREDAEKALKDQDPAQVAEVERMINSMLMKLTDKSPDQRRLLGFREKAKTIAKLSQDPNFHDLLVDCYIAQEHGDDPQRIEAANNLVNVLAQNGAMEQTFVAQLEKTKAVGSQPTMLAGGKKPRGK